MNFTNPLNPANPMSATHNLVFGGSDGSSLKDTAHHLVNHVGLAVAATVAVVLLCMLGLAVYRATVRR